MTATRCPHGELDAVCRACCDWYSDPGPDPFGARADRHAFWCDSQSGYPCDCPFGHRATRRRAGLLAALLILAGLVVLAIAGGNR